MSTDRSRDTRIPAKMITHAGESKSISAWAKQIGLGSGAMGRRIQRWEAGEITEAQCFGPPSKSQLIKTEAEKALSRTKRHYFIDSLMDNFEQHLLPQLPSEVQAYARTGELGPAMRFFITYEKYFNISSYDQKDQASLKATAQVAVIVSATPPTNYTKIT